MREKNDTWKPTPILLGLALAGLVLAALAAPPGAPPAAQAPAAGAPAATTEKKPEGSTMADLETFFRDGRFAAAAELAARLRAEAAARGEEATATTLLIKELQARIGLGEFETALRQLLAAERPAGARERLLLDLFRGETLSRYLDNYGWEIRQREQVANPDPLDPSRWSADELNQAILLSFAAAWEERAAWGNETVTPLAGLLEQNDYPARIRGTLRDTLSYLFAESLGDSSRFSPREANEVFKLDLNVLLGPPAPAEPGAVTADGLHPLERLRLVLADLEAWHLAAGRREAALEARLELLDRLRIHFRGDDARARFERELATALEAFPPGLEWKAMGLARLAEWRREGRQPDALLRAREAALEAAEAFPDSLGGRRGRAIADQIEAPSLRLESMSVDGPRRPSLSLTHANLKAVFFRAWLLPPLPEGQEAVRRSRENELKELRKVKPAAEWRVELQDPGDFRPHRSAALTPLERVGLYLVMASERPDFAFENNLATAVELRISEMVLVGHPGYESMRAEVDLRAGSDGRPIAGARVDLLGQSGRAFKLAASRETGADGRAEFDLAPLEQQSPFHLKATRGDDLVFGGSWFHKPYGMNSPATTSSLIYTDRAVYRPGQKVLFKVIAYVQEANGLERRVEPGAKVEVELYDAGGEQVASQTLETNRHGSAAGEFLLPAGRLLGGWRLQSRNNSINIQVEEYKRPTFELEIEDPAAPLKLNREALVAGSARYYFGMPLRQGRVAWRVTREPAWPRWYWGWRPRTPAQQVAAGEGGLGPDGRFEVRFLPQADPALASLPRGREIAYTYKISALLTDEGGETRTAERDFRAGFVAIDAALEPAAGYFPAGRQVEIALRRFDLDGKGRAGKGTWRLHRLAAGKPLLPADLPRPLSPEEEKFALPGDRTLPRHQAQYDEAAARRLLPAGPELARGEIASDAAGQARLALDRGLAAGVYRLYYETADEQGEKIERSAEFLVGGGGGELPGVGLALLVETEKTQLEVGQELKIVAGSGLAGVGAVLEIFRGQESVLRRELPPGKIVELSQKIVEADRGGLSVELRAVADYQLMVVGRQIAVPLDASRLAVSYATFRDKLRPGQKEKLTLEVKSTDGSSLDPRLVEILAYMYDRSLDLFAKRQPYELFWPLRRNPPPRAESSLGGNYPFWQSERGVYATYPQLRPDRLTFYDQVQLGGPGGVRGGYSPMMRSMAMAPEASPIAEVQALDAGAAMLKSAGDQEGAPPPPPPPPPPAPQEAPGAPADPLRENFSETAFFEPHLQPGDDGRVSFEFTVPDSVTEWSVWAHALADDFRYGAEERQSRTVKELLVRPYLPRFLREGDTAELRVSVDNTGAEGRLEGQVDFELKDEESGESLLAAFGIDPATAKGRRFSVEPGQSEVLSFPVKVPSRLGPVVLRVAGRTTGAQGGELSDGEQRLLPILPSRLHLAQSRFAVLRDQGERVLAFEDLRRDDDPTRVDEKMVLTVDAQLFTSVLRALPYLVDYPYRCTEQNLNRFVSTGIMTSLFDRHPAIARLAKELADKRDTPLEPMAASDPNRSMLLEETPWLATSRGGDISENAELKKVLDPAIAKAVRDGAILELRQAQDASGGFPWFSGGQPSPFFTLYLLEGFARASEFGVPLPREMIERAWGFLRAEFAKEIEKLKDPKEMRERWHEVTWLNYVLSTYPDLSWTGGAFTEDDRARMLEASLLHWRELPPRVRLYLALTAQRAGRADEAKLLLESVMDSAKTTEDQGTYWLPEERAWLFYWDRIETHALALRALGEIAPQDPRRHGLVTWLMLNKKLNQWSSTRSTAEVIYSLVQYLDREGQLGKRQEARVELGGKREKLVFEPDRDEGRRQMVMEGAEIEPKRDAEMKISMESQGLLFASATWHFSTDRLPQEARGDFFAVGRRFYRRSLKGDQYQLQPLEDGAKLAVGDEVEVELEIEAKHQAEYVHLRDPRGAGFEPVDLVSGWRWDLGIVHYREIRDSATNFFFETLPPGKLTLKYRLRATTAGTFRVGPATLQSMYAPEFAAYSAGEEVAIAP
jgi:hypothetical protein